MQTTDTGNGQLTTMSNHPIEQPARTRLEQAQEFIRDTIDTAKRIKSADTSCDWEAWALLCWERIREYLGETGGVPVPRVQNVHETLAWLERVRAGLLRPAPPASPGTGPM